jgi:hypothetical protein
MKPVAEMTELERNQIRAWVRNWQELSPVLERERLESIRRADTMASMEAFDMLYKSARATMPPRTSSGLEEQQRWFRLARQ